MKEEGKNGKLRELVERDKEETMKEGKVAEVDVATVLDTMKEIILQNQTLGVMNKCHL